MSAVIKVVVIGLGPLGQNLARELSLDSRFELLALIDKDPSKVGVKIGDFVITESLTGSLEPDLAFVTTSSKIADIAKLVPEYVKQGIDIVSSCEELVYPWKANPELASELDALARQNQVRILGTGINPGFLMDYFLITLLQAQIISKVESITYTRFIDASTRRVPFQNKVGLGLSKESFDEAFAQGKIGHVGFRESIDMLVDFLNWQIESSEIAIEPVLSGNLVSGINQTAQVRCQNGKKIDFIFNANSENQDRDHIKIISDQSLDLEFSTGVNGEKGTVAMLINSSLKLLQIGFGLRTMLD